MGMRAFGIGMDNDLENVIHYVYVACEPSNLIRYLFALDSWGRETDNP